MFAKLWSESAQESIFSNKLRDLGNIIKGIRSWCALYYTYTNLHNQVIVHLWKCHSPSLTTVQLLTCWSWIHVELRFFTSTHVSVFKMRYESRPSSQKNITLYSVYSYCRVGIFIQHMQWFTFFNNQIITINFRRPTYLDLFHFIAMTLFWNIC